jgi:hypothetical protein
MSQKTDVRVFDSTQRWPASWRLLPGLPWVRISERLFREAEDISNLLFAAHAGRAIDE